MFFSIKTFNYIFKVRYQSKKPPRSDFPREQIPVGKIRGYSRNFINEDEQVVQQIVYPKSLWFTTIEENDPVEKQIIYLKNLFPDWTQIEIEETEL
jgi:hypothetical protein